MAYLYFLGIIMQMSVKNLRMNSGDAINFGGVITVNLPKPEQGKRIVSIDENGEETELSPYMFNNTLTVTPEKLASFHLKTLVSEAEMYWELPDGKRIYNYMDLARHFAHEVFGEDGEAMYDIYRWAKDDDDFDITIENQINNLKIDQAIENFEEVHEQVIKQAVYTIEPFPFNVIVYDDDITKQESFVDATIADGDITKGLFILDTLAFAKYTIAKTCEMFGWTAKNEHNDTIYFTKINGFYLKVEIRGIAVAGGQSKTIYDKPKFFASLGDVRQFKATMVDELVDTVIVTGGVNVDPTDIGKITSDVDRILSYLYEVKSARKTSSEHGLKMAIHCAKDLLKTLPKSKLDGIGNGNTRDSVISAILQSNQ